MPRSIARPIAIVSVLVLLAACGQKSSTVTTTTEVGPVAAPAPAATTARDFVQKVGASDMYEIQAGQVALKRSSNADVRAFGQMMIDAHGKSTGDLVAAVAASGLTLAPPATLPAEQVNLIAALTAAQTSAFDKTYIDQQVEAHQTALDVVQQYANGGDTPMVKAFASNLAPIVQTHLDKARGLQATLNSAAAGAAAK